MCRNQIAVIIVIHVWKLAEECFVYYLRRAVRVDKSLEILMVTGRELSFFLSQMVEFLTQQNEK